MYATISEIELISIIQFSNFLGPQFFHTSLFAYPCCRFFLFILRIPQSFVFRIWIFWKKVISNSYCFDFHLYYVFHHLEFIFVHPEILQTKEINNLNHPLYPDILSIVCERQEFRFRFGFSTLIVFVRISRLSFPKQICPYHQGITYIHKNILLQYNDSLFLNQQINKVS